MKQINIFKKSNLILLKELIVTDFKLRYQGSLLGYAWSLLKPLFLFAIMYFVFGVMIKIGSVEHYPVYLLLGIVLWSFFAESTNQGMNSIVSRGDLLRKINFPKHIIVLSATISALINLLLNLIIVFALMLFNGVGININNIALLFFIIEIYIFSLGLSFYLSALNVKYRDTSHIWEIVMQAAFYATPIIYPLTLVMQKSELIAKILILNPVAQAIQDSRNYLVTGNSITLSDLYNGGYIEIIPILITATTFVTGLIYFRKKSKYFAEIM
jgi:ABC-2 type transport system permease protein